MGIQPRSYPMERYWSRAVQMAKTRLLLPNYAEEIPNPLFVLLTPPGATNPGGC
jgi:hypothetical protein